MTPLVPLIGLIIVWILFLAILYVKKGRLSDDRYRLIRLSASLLFSVIITLIVALLPLSAGFNPRSDIYIYGISGSVAVVLYILGRLFLLRREMHPLTLE